MVTECKFAETLPGEYWWIQKFVKSKGPIMKPLGGSCDFNKFAFDAASKIYGGDKASHCAQTCRACGHLVEAIGWQEGAKENLFTEGL